jgi:RNA polymerase sigma-70 factor (ECF subfamily)
MNNYVATALENHSDMVYRLAFTQMRTKHDADDVYQDVFLALVSKERLFSDEEHLKAWLIRATLNRCKSVKTSVWFKRSVPLDTVGEIAFETEEQSDLSEYLELLPPKYRSVIHLFYHEDLPIAQISKILSAKESTVRTWLVRARAILREKLQGGHFHDE